jgi:hypothetical protein
MFVVVVCGSASQVVVVINRTTESYSETQPPTTKPKALSNFAVLNVCQGMASKGVLEGFFFFLVPLCGKNAGLFVCFYF